VYLVPNDVPPHLERHAVQKFPMRLVGYSNPRDAGPGVFAIDQHGDYYLTAVLSQAPGELSNGLYPRRQPRQHLGRPVGVRDSNQTRSWRTVRLKQQTLSVHALEHWPTDSEYFAVRRLGDLTVWRWSYPVTPEHEWEAADRWPR